MRLAPCRRRARARAAWLLAARTPRTCCRSIARRSSKDPDASPPRARTGRPRRSACRRRARGCCRNVSATGAGQRATIYDAHVQHRRRRDQRVAELRLRQPRCSRRRSRSYRHAERGRARPGARAGDAVRLHAGSRAAGPDPARRAVAYFDVLLAQFNVELAEQQKIAVSEQLAQAKRNFEVGTATITDTNEAQAKYDQIVARRSSARNDLDNRRTALRAIIGRTPRRPARASAAASSRALPDAQQRRLLGRPRAAREPQRARRAVELRHRDARGRPRSAPGTCPRSTSWRARATRRPAAASTSRRRRLQLALGRSSASSLNVPIYTGGFVNSRVREAIALQDNARAGPRGRAAQRAVQRAGRLLGRQQRGGVGARRSSRRSRPREVALQSNIARARRSACARTSTCSTCSRTLFQTRRDLAQAYFNYLLGVLRLKSAVGTLTERGPRGHQPPPQRLNLAAPLASSRREARREPRPQPVGRAAMRGVERERRVAHALRARAAIVASSAPAVATSASASATRSAAPRRDRLRAPPRRS